MKYEPHTRNLVLLDEDLHDPRVRAGWDQAVEDDVAVTTVTRHGQTLQVREIPKAVAEGYLPGFMVKVAVRLGLQETAGDEAHAWTGWQPSLGEDEDEW